MKLIAALAVFLIFENVRDIECQGGGGGNNGPIFDTHPEHFCQNKIFPHFPVIEFWIDGTWKLSHIFQQQPKGVVECVNVAIETEPSELENKTITVTSLVGGEQVTRQLIGRRSSLASPAKLIVNSHKDGLVADSSKYPIAYLGIETVIFVNFASTIDDRSLYDTGLYVVCYQGYTGESYSPGIPMVSEVGILSRTGIVKENFIMEHYNNIFENIKTSGLIPDPAAELRPVSQCNAKEAP